MSSPRPRLAIVVLALLMAAHCPLRAEQEQAPAAEARSSSPSSSPSRSQAEALPPPHVQRLESAFATFEARDLDDRLWTAQTLRGRIVLIDFWATWCAPCLVELPALRRLHAAHARQPFTILGVNLDAMDRRTLAGWIRRQGLAWPQIHDRRAYGGPLPRAFDVEALPRTMLFDGEGRVIAVDLRGDALARAVAQALATPAPSPHAYSPPAPLAPAPSAPAPRSSPASP
jgi:thiol-disulfide isomerase/thioredoxin